MIYLNQLEGSKKNEQEDLLIMCEDTPPDRNQS